MYNKSLIKKKANATSFWIDTIKNQNNITSNQGEDYQNEDALDSSDLNKNNDILQQIRKIMGNLEYSDADDELDENILNDQKGNKH